MTAYQLIAPLPLVALDQGCTVTFEAIDSSTGAAVTGVSVTLATIYADNSAYTPTTIERTPMYALEPLI